MMTKEPDKARAAEAAVAAFEALEIGQPYADQADAASAAVSVLTAAARAVLFPPIASMTADVITAFTFYEELFERSRYGERAAALHAECLATQPDLATFLRAWPVCARVAAAAVATGPAVSQDAVGDRAVEQYRQMIAAQLVGVDEFEPAATNIVTRAPSLQARIETCRARHQQHVAAELERMELERRIASEAIVNAEREQRAELAAYFSARLYLRFIVRGEAVSGQALAAIVRGDGAYSDRGELFKASLAELMVVRDRQVAADAAIQSGGLQ